MRCRSHFLTAALTLVAGGGCGEPTGPPSSVNRTQLTITTTSLPRALAGLPYRVVLTSAGGVLPHAWDAQSGGPLPQGLTLSIDGVISGTPTASVSGLASFWVGVTGGNGARTSVPMWMEILRVLEPHELCADDPGGMASFADASLDHAVEGMLGGGDPMCRSLPSVRNLFHTTQHPVGISSLQGAQNLTALDYVLLIDYNFRDNSIADLSPLATLETLRWVNLSDNEIEDVSPLAGLDGLRTLILNDNRVSDLTPLAGLTNLEQLWVGRGAFIPLALNWPQPKGDPITGISALSGLTSLRDLWIHGQAITNLDALAGLPAFESLNAHNNAITDITGLAGKPSLLSVRLGSNAISDISPLSNLPSLGSISIDNNLIRHAALSGLPNLRSLNLSHNPLEEVGPLGGLVGLSSLTLVGTQVADLSPLSALASSLRFIDLSETSVTDLGPLAEFASLRELALSNNAIADIGPIAGLTSLERVQLDGNALLVDIQPLLINPGLGPRNLGIRDFVDLRGTSVSCATLPPSRQRGSTSDRTARRTTNTLPPILSSPCPPLVPL